ncbi:MAG TPA: peptidase [Stackebrandtia sp.]|jgi:V8-like Glu-specific endopeptidase|uniref:trypsin-like serine peptidase n=1 Tax=Stackebrandtia sp. TaxID=2023065 RepID=UPI002D4731A3|nr:peptidase [Stackebrandtia sp.]HZE37237.1 peptidase [Stackebrandtia sp.]
MKAARLALVSLAGAALLIASPASALAQPSSSHLGTAVHSLTNVDGASDHWTSQRMKDAKLLDVSLEGKDLSAKVKVGAQHDVDPTLADSGGDPWSGGGDVVHTSGRVFFTFQGKDAACSGDAVTSTNGSTVLTAGHCVKYQGTWHTNWVFVPGYDNGQAPYGKWSASKTLTTPQWEADEDENYDVGAAVVSPLDGKKLTDTVGGQGLSFNGEYNQNMYAFGFPAEDPYDGEKLIYCAGQTTQDVLLTHDHGLSCDMTGGSSGGPWFVDFDESTGAGKQASVNSFGYTFLPGVMYGPYFGDDVQNLYNTAQGT